MSLVAAIAPGMLDSIWVKLAPGTPLIMAWRLMVDTALGADCTSMLPLPSDTELPVTLTASSWSARWVALELVVLEVVVLEVVVVVVVEVVVKLPRGTASVPAASWAKAVTAAAYNTAITAGETSALFMRRLPVWWRSLVKTSSPRRAQRGSAGGRALTTPITARTSRLRRSKWPAARQHKFFPGRLTDFEVVGCHAFAIRMQLQCKARSFFVSSHARWSSAWRRPSMN